ncbi:MAG: DUF2877 domain-containing protein [Clostridiales bacterium]|nr:DUF2877 domain-containing protein [Clostridiales bacterium]
MMKINIICGTTKAKEFLHCNGTVVGIFDKCFNILTQSKQMLTIFNKTDRFSTRGLVSEYEGSFYDLPISVNESVIIDSGKIKLANIMFNYSDMQVYETYRQPLKNIEIEETVFEEMLEFLNKYKTNSPLICEENLIYKKFNQGIEMLKINKTKGFQMLVGLGIGLTPSADDFLSGITAFFHIINYLPEFNLSLAKYLEQNGMERTSFVSCNLLKDVCQGHINEDLYNLLHSLVNKKGNIEFLTKQMIDYGSTSGYETCLGIIAGYKFYKNGDLDNGSYKLC